MRQEQWNRLVEVADATVRQTLATLPEEIRSEANRLPVILEGRPSRALCDDGIGSDTLGLFTGNAYPDGISGCDPIPVQIILYLENLWEYVDEDEERFCEEVQTTFLHELGHYLGLDESDLQDRDLE